MGVIYNAVLARQKRKAEEQEAENLKKRERLVARVKLTARGISWKPDHDQIIDAGGTADDVVETATAEKIWQAEEKDRLTKSSERETAVEDSAREASVAVSRGQGLLANRQFQKLARDDPRRQSIADAALRGTIAQRREATKELEPPKSEKATDREMDRAARFEYARDNLPNNGKTRLWIQIGGEPPDKETAIPTPAGRAADAEQSWLRLKTQQPKSQKAVENDAFIKKTAGKVLRPEATPSDYRLAGMTPDELRDSSITEADYVGKLKAQVAGGDVPDAQAQAILQRIDSLQTRLDRLRARR